ncbi:MAG: serine/threonine protein phosphatase [Deltaproteobacteria bacterium]|nr:serine/threonine protein phosphatase [Deltaproteobacteria bacterium]
MGKSNLYKNKDRLIDLFKSEGRWLKIPDTTGRCIIFSDPHNDGRTTHFIIDRYLINTSNTKIIICGDYGDRSPFSWQAKPTATIDYLLKLKLKYPDRLYMLMGNHDLNPKKYQRFLPCDFWESLSQYDENFYTEILESLPIVATTPNNFINVICTHGVLPDNKKFFDDFDLDNETLKDCLWSDYVETISPIKKQSLRKEKGYDDFYKSMKSFKSTYLIKGHNPRAPLKMFDNKCITLSTTRVFKGVCDRHIAIIELGKQIKSTDDIELVNIDNLIEL